VELRERGIGGAHAERDSQQQMQIKMQKHRESDVQRPRERCGGDRDRQADRVAG